MARGYPEPSDQTVPPTPQLGLEGVCPICKHRAARARGDVCAECAKKLEE